MQLQSRQKTKQTENLESSGAPLSPPFHLVGLQGLQVVLVTIHTVIYCKIKCRELY